MMVSLTRITTLDVYLKGHRNFNVSKSWIDIGFVHYQYWLGYRNFCLRGREPYLHFIGIVSYFLCIWYTAPRHGLIKT